MGLSSFYETVERKIGNVFARFGRFVARHPWKVIAIVIIINGGLGVGIIKLHQRTDAENIYLPTGTQARIDRQRVAELFSDYIVGNMTSLTTTYGYWAHVIIKSKTGNLLSRTALESVKSLNEYVQSLTYTSDSGTIILFSDICLTFGTNCYVNGDLFFSEDFLAAVDSDSVSYPEFTTSSGGVNYEANIGGTIQTDDTGTYLKGMEYILLEYYFRLDTGEKNINITGWLDNFIIKMGEISSDYFDVAYSHVFSVSEELEKTITSDIILFVVTIVLMIVYACVATMSAGCDCVSQRMMLGFGGVLAAGLAIVASFGLCSVLGVAFVSTVGMVPFLVIGIGIDDMFILLSGLAGAQDQRTVENKIGETLRTSGVGITITSLTDFLAFLAGAVSNFLAVQNFCIYTGVAVIFCYFNNITFFTACMAINEYRINDSRHFATCRKTKSKKELKNDGNSTVYGMFCGGSPASSRKETESLIDRIPRWLIPKIVLKTPMKIIILVVFALYLAAAIYGCIHLTQGIEFKDLVYEDSYYYNYGTWKENYLQRVTSISYIIDGTYTYSDSYVQSEMEWFLSHAKSDSNFDSSYELSWLASFKSSSYYDSSSEINFILALQNFLTDSQYLSFASDIVIDTDNYAITASRFHLKSADMEDSYADGQLMVGAREIASESSLSCFAYSFSFIYFEQYIAVLPQSIQSVGIALAAIFIITCLFMPHPLLIFCVTLTVLMIMTGVIGFLYYVNVSLSFITMIHLIMSIGFSVDFAAHICHGFMTANGETRHERVTEAVERTGAPILHGFLSSCIGIVVLAFAKSYIFRTFAIVVAFVLVFGIAHALLLLTAVLSWIGPGKLKHVTVAPELETRPSERRKLSKLDIVEMD